MLFQEAVVAAEAEEAETGGEAAVVVAVPQVSVPEAAVNSNLKTKLAQDSIRVPNTQISLLVIGQGARCTSGGGAKQIFVQNPQPVRGEMSFSQNKIKIEGPTSLVRIMLQSTQ